MFMIFLFLLFYLSTSSLQDFSLVHECLQVIQISRHSHLMRLVIHLQKSMRRCWFNMTMHMVLEALLLHGHNTSSRRRNGTSKKCQIYLSLNTYKGLGTWKDRKEIVHHNCKVSISETRCERRAQRCHAGPGSRARRSTLLPWAQPIESAM